MNELSNLRALSYTLGVNPMLVQAGGGNTSLKTPDGLWIKASGTRLADAKTKNIFVFLPWSRLDEWESGAEEALSITTEDGTVVRASVETAMHTSLPHRFVAHVHSVRAIGWLIQPALRVELERRMHGLRWMQMPYIHPGRTLALEMRRLLEGRSIDILFLENHGVVIGASSAEELMTTMDSVESLLEAPLRDSSLAPAFDGPSFSLPGWKAVEAPPHAIAFDQEAIRLASAGTLYPDHCVYLGPAIAAAEDLEDVPAALRLYEAQHRTAAKGLLARNVGAFIRVDAGPAAIEMLHCLANVLSRVRPGATLQYLSDENVGKLMHWDAEAYRIQVEAKR